MNKEKAIQIGNETLQIIEKGEYSNTKGQIVSLSEDMNKSIKNARLYSPQHAFNDSVSSKEEKTIIKCEASTTLEAAISLLGEGYENVCCLNFASAKHPGGGFLKGSRAQEESLARSSSLYPTIAQFREMYNHNHHLRSGFYSDYMSFSPNVPVFRKDNGELLDNPYTVSFITSAAVNAGVIAEREPHRKKEIEVVMKNRMRKILHVAKENKQEALVLGAFGCGVFKNNVSTVARLFKELLNEPPFQNAFSKVVFAIYERESHKPMLATFERTFGLRRN